MRKQLFEVVVVGTESFDSLIGLDCLQGEYMLMIQEETEIYYCLYALYLKKYCTGPDFIC